MTIELDFNIDNSFNRTDLLAEAIEIVEYANLSLGPTQETRAGTLDLLKLEAIELLNNFKAQKAAFAPRLLARRLKKADLQVPDSDLSAALKEQYRHYNFYHIDIPITLISDTGWAFSRLECKIDFAPTLNTAASQLPAAQLPLIHDLFPSDEWQDILSFSDHLQIGLDQNLNFKAEAKDLQVKGPQIDSATQAKIATVSTGGAALAIGPFSYTLRRPTIKSRGRDNTKAYWHLEGRQAVDEQDLKLSVVLKVPKNRPQPVNAVAALQAKHNFNFLTADVFKDFLRSFGSGIKAFLKGGAPITATQAWEDITG